MFKRAIFSVFIAISLLSGATLLSPQPQALACEGGGEGSDVHIFNIIPPWHHHLPCDGDGVSNDIQLSDLWSIGFAVLEGITAAAGLLGVVFVLWGGIKYITSQGSPDGTASARKTIINAIAGIIIAASATVFVSFAFQTLSGGSGISTAGVGDDGRGAVERVLGVVYTVIGAVAVIYVIIGAIKFATSTGDPGKAASARNTIIYALVGLVVAIAAGTITNFVLTEI